MRGFAAFARRYPRRDTLAASPELRSRRGVRRHIILHLFLWNELRVLSMETREDFSFVADKHHSFSLQFLVVRVPLIRRRRLDGTVIPEKVQRRAGAFGREFEANGAGGREGVVVFYANSDVAGTRAKMAGPGIHRDGSIQLEHLEHGPETVMPHVGQRTAAELIPAAKHGVGVVWIIGPVQRRPQP